MVRKLSAIVFIFVLWFAAMANAKPLIDDELADVLRSSDPDKELKVIVRLHQRPDFAAVKSGKLTRANFIKGLKTNERYSLAVMKSFPKSRSVKKLSSLWLITGFSLTADAGAIRKLAERSYVYSLSIDKTVSIPQTVYSNSSAPLWNISQINAPALWSLGFTGSGVTVGVMDSGADIGNPHLIASYRGGSNSWFDPTGTHTSPYDADGHGTQVLGIIVGANNIDTTIGIAPAAKWIAAKIFNDAGTTTFSDIHLAFQWFLDPDSNPDTDDTPQIINCSWGLRDNVDQCVNEFRQDVSLLREAGITVVFAAGNENVNPLYPSSISPANYPESFSVGSLNSQSIVSYSSSRGPSACYGSIYPKLAAPGEYIETCDLSFGGLFDQHVYVDGTSFAAPHVTAAMALVLSAFAQLNTAQVENVFTASAFDLDIPGPDNNCGYGLVDTAGAYQLAASVLGGDFNLNYQVDMQDVAILADEWLSINCFDCKSDTNGDGSIDLADFAALAGHFGDQ